MAKERKVNKIRKWLKNLIKNLIEIGDWVIQIVYLLLILVFYILFDWEFQEAEVVIVELLFVFSGELFILVIKNNSIQQKIRRVEAKQDTNFGRLFRIAKFDIGTFFDNTNSELFVSGVTLFRFFSERHENIENLLGGKKKLYVLMVDPEAIVENAKMYYGVADNVTICEAAEIAIRNEKYIIEKIMQEHKQAFCEGTLKLKVSNTVFTTSFVANDCMQKEKKGVIREIKASFYQYGCEDTSKTPNILVKSQGDEEWYKFFRQTIHKQWNSAQEIRGLDALDDLLKRLEAKKAEISN